MVGQRPWYHFSLSFGLVNDPLCWNLAIFLHHGLELQVPLSSFIQGII